MNRRLALVGILILAGAGVSSGCKNNCQDNAVALSLSGYSIPLKGGGGGGGGGGHGGGDDSVGGGGHPDDDSDGSHPVILPRVNGTDCPNH